MQFVLIRECRRVGNNISEENKNVCNVFPQHGATKTCSLIQVTGGNPTPHWSTSSLFDKRTDQQSAYYYIVQVHPGSETKHPSPRMRHHTNCPVLSITLPHSFRPSFPLVRSYRKLVPSFTPRLANGKRGERPPFPAVVHSKSTGKNRFLGVRGRPAWAGRRRSSRRGSPGGSRRTCPRRRVHTTCRVGGSGYWQEEETGVRRRATATAGEERERGKNGKPRRRGDKYRRWAFGLR